VVSLQFPLLENHVKSVDAEKEFLREIHGDGVIIFLYDFSPDQ